AGQDARHHQNRAQKNGDAEGIERRHCPPDMRAEAPAQIAVFSSLSPRCCNANSFLAATRKSRIFGRYLRARPRRRVALACRIWDSRDASNQVWPTIGSWPRCARDRPHPGHLGHQLGEHQLGDDKPMDLE
ncbi:hypothetical protein CEE98_12865, partial [Lactobacillus crispatus]